MLQVTNECLVTPSVICSINSSNILNRTSCVVVFLKRGVLTISSDLTTVLQVLNEVVPNLEENGSRHGSDEIDVRMLVHQSQAGCVIGKGGLKIKELREGGFRKTITRSTAKRGLACSEICNVAKWLVTFSRLRETKPNTANPSTRFVIEVSLKKCHYVAILCLSTLKN
uniref:K Homology domain-containing protein n=1 Tax=Vespula pensylvanica TaxID=30213 RepID=A0A834UAF6_VESPE|nr:hypothetical protein H0235_008347 [Vespula pensylvanica]